LREISRLKTGSLLGWCLQVGSRLAGRPSEQVEHLRRIGVDLGIAFQMVDDVIDTLPGGEKGFGKDLEAGLVNWVTYEWLTEHPKAKPSVEAVFRGEKRASKVMIPESGLLRAHERVRGRAGALLASVRDRIRALALPRDGEPYRAILLDWTTELEQRRQ
jgi:geranylgeranyl pyrophosphate synthase